MLQSSLMKRISVVINTLNEAKNLPRAIASVKNLADEIVVVDMESDDGTSDIAKKLGARVFSHKRVGYVEPARNFAISKATGDWIFILDADEEVGPELNKLLKRTVEKPKADYYRVPRKNMIFGKWMKHSRWWPDNNIRLFKKGHVSWNEVIHSVPITTGKGADFPEKEQNSITHYHYETIEQYIERMNRYTTVNAKTRIKEGYKFSWKDLVVRPAQEFFSRYFFGQGYKDGVHGLASSMLQAFSELSVYLKIWQSEKFKDENIGSKNIIELMRSQEKELHYWQSDALLRETGNQLYRIKRKLKI